eukprot:353440-Chlamydomonas_euryale.AAC.4
MQLSATAGWCGRQHEGCRAMVGPATAARTRQAGLTIDGDNSDGCIIQNRRVLQGLVGGH